VANKEILKGEERVKGDVPAPSSFIANQLTYWNKFWGQWGRGKGRTPSPKQPLPLIPPL